MDNVREYITEAISSTEISDNVVRNVKILGEQSKNQNRRYPREVMREAVRRYEGKVCNVNHPERGKESAGRAFGERFGVWKNVHVAEGNELRGDLHFNPEHAEAKSFMWWVKNQPGAIGFSHVARLKEKRVGNAMLVEAIEEVKCVDLVADPATTMGVFEDVEGGDDEGEQTPSELPLTGRGRALSMLSDDQFAYIEPGGKKDGGGRTSPRSKRYWPLDNADSIRAALNSIPRLERLNPEDKAAALTRATRAAAKFHITLPGKAAAATKEDVMSDYASLTLEDLRAQRPELVDAITREANQGEAHTALVKEHAELKKRLATMEAEAIKAKREGEIAEMLEEAGIDPKNPKHVKKHWLSRLLATEDAKEVSEMIQERAEELDEAGLLGTEADAGDVEPVQESRGANRFSKPVSRFSTSSTPVGSFDYKDSKGFLAGLRRG